MRNEARFPLARMQEERGAACKGMWEEVNGTSFARVHAMASPMSAKPEEQPDGNSRNFLMLPAVRYSRGPREPPVQEQSRLPAASAAR